LNKLPKYIFIALIAINVLGGTILGTREYLENKEARRAFEHFYKSDSQVLGAYDKKVSNASSQNYSLYIAGGTLLFILSFSMGVAGAHIFMKKKQKKISQSVPLNEKQPLNALDSKKIVRL